MRKMKNIIIFTLFVIMLIISFVALNTNIGFVCSEKDLLLYRIGGFALTVSYAIGFLIEIIMSKFTNGIKNNPVKKRVILWCSIVIFSITAFIVCYGLTSNDFKNDMSKYNMNMTQKSKIDKKDKSVEKNRKIAKEKNIDDLKSDESIDNSLEWLVIAKDADRYKEIMMMIGENFYTYRFEEKDYSGLDKNEVNAVKDLYSYYTEKNKLPEDFKSAFTEFCKRPEYEDMIIETDDNPFYAALSNSFTIGWKSDGTYHLSIKEKKNKTGERKDVDGKVFLFDDATFKVNGIEITFNSVKFDKTDRALNGYEAIFDYTVKNSNSHEATLKFSANEGQFRCRQGKVVFALSSINAASNKYASSLKLKADETVSNKLVMLHALSNRFEVRTNGVDYGKVEIGDIYEDERIEMDMVLVGWLLGKSETLKVSFTLN